MFLSPHIIVLFIWQWALRANATKKNHYHKYLSTALADNSRHDTTGTGSIQQIVECIRKYYKVLSACSTTDAKTGSQSCIWNICCFLSAVYNHLFAYMYTHAASYKHMNKITNKYITHTFKSLHTQMTLCSTRWPYARWWVILSMKCEH